MSDVIEAGFVRVRLVSKAVSGGPEMSEENVKIAVHALRRASEARARARKAQIRPSNTPKQKRLAPAK